ncbi:hypothetical protein D3C84_366590 [compost metagenome]
MDEDHLLEQLARPYDGHLGWRDDRAGITACDGTEVGQGDGRPLQHLPRHGARLHIGDHPIQSVPNVRPLPLGHVLHDRHIEPVFGVDGDGHIDFPEQSPRQSIPVKPGIHGGFGTAGNPDGLDEAHSYVLVYPPVAQVHLVGNADWHHRLMRVLHRLCHGSARPLEKFVAAALQRFEGALHVLLGHHASTAGTLEPVDVQPQLLRQQTHRRHGLHQGATGRHGPHHEVILDVVLMGADLAHHGAVIFAAFELNQGGTDVKNIPLGTTQPGDHPRHRRGHIHQRLGSFHRQQHLIDTHGIAGTDLPFDYLGLGQTFAQIR